jgi:hypothetical protein
MKRHGSEDGDISIDRSGIVDLLLSGFGVEECYALIFSFLTTFLNVLPQFSHL